jgi:hypothetical protein
MGGLTESSERFAAIRLSDLPYEQAIGAAYQGEYLAPGRLKNSQRFSFRKLSGLPDIVSASKV